MSKAKRYIVHRGIERDGKWRFEPGDVVTARQISGADIKAWLASGVLEQELDFSNAVRREGIGLDDNPDVED